jgi:hypothetical protein
MSDATEFNAEQAAQITERIGETFDFVRDVLNDPTILEDIPDGANLDLRNVTIQDHIYHIVAYPAAGGTNRWIARTTGATNVDESHDRQFSVSIRLLSDLSAEAAMDSVESALRAAAQRDQAARRIA